MEGKYSVVKEFLTEKTNIPYFMLVDVFGGTVRVCIYNYFIYRIAGNFCWNLILRFAVEIKIAQSNHR